MLCILSCIRELAGNAKYVCTFSDIIFKIFFATFVCDLRQAGFLTGECLIEIKKLQLRIWQVSKLRRENCSLGIFLFIFISQSEVLPGEGVKVFRTEGWSDEEAHVSHQVLCRSWLIVGLLQLILKTVLSWIVLCNQGESPHFPAGRLCNMINAQIWLLIVKNTEECSPS